MLLLFTPFVKAEFYTFTLHTGRSLEAEIISFNDETGHVELKQENGRRANVSPSVFIKKDENFILAWASKKNPTETPPVEVSGRRFREIVETNFPVGNVYIGATASFRGTEGEDGRLLADEFSYITPANDFKQSYIHPEPGKWRWEAPDGWIEFAEQHNQMIRIHGPISPQCSKWTMEDHRTPKELEQNLEEYMTELCKRYSGHKRVLWMDVVNETVSRDGSWKKAQPGARWEMPWESIGYKRTPSRFKHLDGKIPLYIIQAFKIATEHAPDTKLVLNQHGGMEKPMWDKVKDMIHYLRSIGCRVDGVGWQGHIRLTSKEPVQWESGEINTQELSELISWAHQNDLEFHVTENNIHVRPQDEGNEEEHAAVFEGIFKTILENRGTGVVTWNLWTLSDRDHFKADNMSMIGLWDRRYQPKKAYYDLQNLLENPPQAK